jgi:SAM-dependent methyltransferase
MRDPRAFWNERYAAEAWVYGERPNDFVAEVASQILAGGPVLCLAEGEGRNAVHFAERGHAVHAVDLSEVGLAKARRLADARGVTVTTECADLADYRIEPDHWAGIVMSWMHLPSALRRDVIARAADGLREGGVLIFEAYTPAQLAFGTGGPKELDMLVDPDDLRRELGGLHVEHFAAIEREVNEGPFHGGRSAVVQAVARRTG